MTEKEAINGLRNIFNEHELDLPHTDSLETLHMAISAIEKQIPKKRKMHSRYGKRYETLKCP